MTNQTSNVTPITDQQPTQQTKFTIQATLDGFPIVLEGEGRAGDLRLIIDRLNSIGAELAQAAAPTPTEPTKKITPTVCFVGLPFAVDTTLYLTDIGEYK